MEILALQITAEWVLQQSRKHSFRADVTSNVSAAPFQAFPGQTALPARENPNHPTRTFVVCNLQVLT